MKPSVLHLYAYGQLRKEMNGNGRIIHISKIHPIVKWFCRVPSKIRIEFIKELCEAGLLKRLDRDNYELILLDRKPLHDSLGNPLW